MNRERIQEAQFILDEAIALHNPSHIFVMFSGGYDSLMTTHVSMSHLEASHADQERYVAHINTGIGIEETRQFVRETCVLYQWPLKEYRTPNEYEQIVLKHGFPGPAAHRYMYVMLKERAIKALMRDHTPTHGTQQEKHRRMLFVTGVRKEESVRRMGHVKPIQQDGRYVWVAPLLHWTKTDILDYRDEHALPHNPVVDTLHMSGECLCGSYAKPGELEEIALWYPQAAQEIRRIEQQAAICDVPCRWGHKPPSYYAEIKHGQAWLPGMSPLCSSCDARFEQAEGMESV